jgi:SH3-like domain-containing protein
MAVFAQMFRRTIAPMIALLLVMPAALPPAALAQSAGAAQRGPSGLPLPRFVSLKASRVNLRVGPGQGYAVEWLYLKKGLPLEVIQEYDNWRRVRDHEGTEGWIYQSLLSGARTGMAAPWLRDRSRRIELRNDPAAGARVVALVEPGAVGDILSCDGEWCRMRFGAHEGWLDQSAIWGIYPGEKFER